MGSRGENIDLLPPISGFINACPRLTELTVIYPHPDTTLPPAETGGPFDRAGSARSAISELVIACKALPDFDTLQIVYFPSVKPLMMCGCYRMRYGILWSEERRKRVLLLREEVECMKDWAMDCLRKPEAGCRDGEARKNTTLRVTELSPASSSVHLGSVRVKEYKVSGPDSENS